jgi:hypothetical protein
MELEQYPFFRLSPFTVLLIFRPYLDTMKIAYIQGV